MPRLKPTEVAAALKPSRTPAQLANDARLRARKQKVQKIKNVAPVVIRPMVESQEQQIGQDGIREFNKDNEIPHVKTESLIDISGARRKKGGPRGQQWLDDMAFANEIVKVMVHESTDKIAHPFPEVNVNGRVQRFVRGHEQKVKRFFVEKLARLKLTAFDNVKTKDVDGEDVYRYPTHTGLVYPFTVIEDSEKGKQWLKQILAEP